MADPELFPPEGFYRADEAYRVWMERAHGFETLANDEIDKAMERFVTCLRDNHHRVCIFTSESERLAIPSAAWNHQFASLIPLHKSVPAMSGPWQAYSGNIVIVPKEDLEDWAMQALRNNLYSKIANGRMLPTVADGHLAELKLPPLLDNPLPEQFHPEKEPYWTLPMAVAWIVWRDLHMVTRNSEPFTDSSFVWGDNKGPGQQEVGSIPERLPRPNLPLMQIGFQLDCRLSSHAVTMTAIEAQAELERKFQQGELHAIGTPPHGRPMPIPAHEWTGLDLVEHKGRDALMVGGASLEIAYEFIRVSSKAVMTNWCAPAEQSSIWDFALDKSRGDRDATARLVVDFYRAFWRGEFNKLELSLVYDQINELGPGRQGGYSRHGLATVVLGEGVFKELGEEKVFADLANWNITDYQKVRQEFRNYLVPDDGIGSAASQRRGLHAPADLLEKWASSQQQRNLPTLETHESKFLQTATTSSLSASKKVAVPTSRDGSGSVSPKIEQAELAQWFLDLVKGWPDGVRPPGKESLYGKHRIHFKNRAMASRKFHEIRSQQNDKAVLPLSWRQQGKRAADWRSKLPVEWKTKLGIA